MQINHKVLCQISFLIYSISVWYGYIIQYLGSIEIYLSITVQEQASYWEKEWYCIK